MDSKSYIKNYCETPRNPSQRSNTGGSYLHNECDNPKNSESHQHVSKFAKTNFLSNCSGKDSVNELFTMQKLFYYSYFELVCIFHSIRNKRSNRMDRGFLANHISHHPTSDMGENLPLLLGIRLHFLLKHS